MAKKRFPKHAPGRVYPLPLGGPPNNMVRESSNHVITIGKKHKNNASNDNKKVFQNKVNKGNKKKTSKTSSNTNTSFNFTGALGPDDIKKYIEALVNLQTKPAINAANRQMGAAQRLGDQASGNVSSYYKSLANAEAENVTRSQVLGSRLKADVSSAGTQGAQAAQSAADTATTAATASDALRGQSSARDELAQLVAAQQGRQAAQNATMNANASGQAADYEAFAGLMAQANQMHGAGQVADIQRGTANAVAEALAKRTEVEGARGDLAYTTLKDLRDDERNYALSTSSLGLKNSDAAQKAAYRKFSVKQQTRNIKSKERYQNKQNKANQKLQSQRAANSLNYLQTAAATYGAGGGGGTNPTIQKEWPAAKANFKLALGKLKKGANPSGFTKQQWALFQEAIAGEGVSPATAQAFVKRYKKHLRTKSRNSANGFAGAKVKGKAKAR